MRAITTICLATLAISAGAHAQPVRTIYTMRDAPLCALPFSIKEAKTAIAAHDEKWLRELSCVQAPAGLASIVVEVNRPLAFFKVRVQPLPGGDAMTLYGSLYDFTEPAAVQPPKLLRGKTQ